MKGCAFAPRVPHPPLQHIPLFVVPAAAPKSVPGSAAEGTRRGAWPGWFSMGTIPCPCCPAEGELWVNNTRVTKVFIYIYLIGNRNHFLIQM